MRYLTDQPVEACPPSGWYRFGKFARRNRAALAKMASLVSPYCSAAHSQSGMRSKWDTPENSPAFTNRANARGRTPSVS